MTSETPRRFKRWFWRPPRAHGEVIADRQVSVLELFYDLVYVAVIGRAAHHLAEHVTVGGVAEFAVVFALIWIAWINGSLYLELHGREDGRTRSIVFGIGGERDLTERELPHLSGWRGSRPVRVGNGAWNQRQLDVYGELLGAAQRLVEQLGQLDEPTRSFLVAAADTAGQRWTEKDQGIWEIRGEPREFLYSKLVLGGP